MGDSDEEYDRRRVRDKFKRERSDYQDRHGGRREDWPGLERDSGVAWGGNSSGNRDRINSRGGTRDYSRDSYGGSGGTQRRDRYGSPADRSDMSPPMKRVRNTRNDWDERGNYGSSNNYDYQHSGNSWNPLESSLALHSAAAAAAAAFSNNSTGSTTHQSTGPTQPPMMTFKQFLATQDDSVDDMEAVKKYNEYKTEFKRQQIAEFFAAHKEEEWFKSRYHPDEFDKRKQEQQTALKNRLKVFLDLMETGWIDSVSIDVEKSDQIIRLLDAAVIKLEGGTDFDLKALDTKCEDEKPKEPDLSLFSVDVEKPPPKKDTDWPEEGEEKSMEGDNDNTKPSDEEKSTKLESEPITDEKIKNKGIKDESKEEDQQSDPAEAEEAKESQPKVEEEQVEVKKEPSEDMEDGETSMDKEMPKEEEEDKKLEEGEEEDLPEENQSEIKKEETQDENMKEENGSKQTEESQEAKEEDPKPRPLHKKDSIFLRNIAPNITKAEIEEMCKKFPGFLRVAIADPAPDRKFYRRGWVTFEKLGNIREICWQMTSIKLKDCELGAIVNRDLTRRIRSVNGIASHKNVIRADIRHAAKIVLNLDQQRRIWDDEDPDKKDGDEKVKDAFGLQTKNPLLKNIGDYMIEEASAEEEELLGDQAGDIEIEDIPGGQSLERDENLIKVLDRLLLYLRIVHSVDYYNHSDYPNEDEMPNRIGIMHARGAPPSSKVTSQEINEYIKAFEAKIRPYLQPPVVITEEEAAKLGKKDSEKEVEEFIKENTQEIGKDKWLCPLSGKKFKGPDFVRKHIFNKHEDRLQQVRKDVDYFNNYLMDPKRPQLPEHPTNRPPNPQATGRTDAPNMGSNGPAVSASPWPHPPGPYPTPHGYPGFPLRAPLAFANPMATWTALSRNYPPMAPPVDYARGGGAAAVTRNRYGARHDPREVVGYADLDENLEMI